jgi:hypothetical protein
MRKFSTDNCAVQYYFHEDFPFVSLSDKSIIILLQIPFSVVLGWIMGQPMDLNFQLFETTTLFISVLVVALMLQVCISATKKNKSL